MNDERGWPVPGSEPEDKEKAPTDAASRALPASVSIQSGAGKEPPSDNVGKMITGGLSTALAAVMIYAAYHLYWRQDEIRNSIILAVAIAIALLFAGMRQYHLYRSALQELIVGRRQKAEEAEAKAKADKQAAKDTSELTKKIEALTAKFDAQSKSENTSLEEFGKTLASNSNSMQSFSLALASVRSILEDMRKPKPSQRSPKPGDFDY